MENRHNFEYAIDGESVEAFRAFLAYRNMEGKRSLSKLAEQEGSREASLKRWSADFHWQARCRACDSHQARQLLDRAVDEVVAQRGAQIRRQLEGEMTLLDAFSELLLAVADGIRSMETFKGSDLLAVTRTYGMLREWLAEDITVDVEGDG